MSADFLPFFKPSLIGRERTVYSTERDAYGERRSTRQTDEVRAIYTLADSEERGEDGVAIQIDGTIILPAGEQYQPSDLFIIDGERYEIVGRPPRPRQIFADPIVPANAALPIRRVLNRGGR